MIASQSPAAGRAAFARVEVDAQRDVAEVGQAVGDVADVLVEAHRLVDHDDRAARLVAGSPGGRDSR